MFSQAPQSGAVKIDRIFCLLPNLFNVIEHREICCPRKYQNYMTERIYIFIESISVDIDINIDNDIIYNFHTIHGERR